MTRPPRKTTAAVGNPRAARPEDCPTPSRVPLERGLAEQRAGQFSDAITAYRCPCGGWHVGKVDAALQRKLDKLGGASC